MPRKAIRPVPPERREIAAQVQNQKLVADRRARIIRAAVSVFHRLGYHLATTADIAREAGLTQSNLYNYVSSKQDVLFLVFEHLVNMYEDVLDQVSAQFEDPHRRIIECLHAILMVMEEYHQEVQLLYSEINALEEPDRSNFSAMAAHVIRHFELLLDDYVKAGGTVADPDRRLLANLASFTPAVLSLRKWDLDAHPAQDRKASLLSFILRGLGIPPLPIPDVRPAQA